MLVTNYEILLQLPTVVDNIVIKINKIANQYNYYKYWLNLGKIISSAFLFILKVLFIFL